MTLIDGDRIVTAQLYDDQYEEFTEKKMSIIDYVNAYTDEGVTTADDILDKIRDEIEEYRDGMPWESKSLVKWEVINYILEQIIDKYKGRKH